MFEGGGRTYQVELLLKLFVCVVDAELLKAVDVERFEAEGAEELRGRAPVKHTAAE